jgi:hypothetical protein
LAVERDPVVVLFADHRACHTGWALTDRQAWLIAAREWQMPRLSVALFAGRSAQYAHGSELAGCGNFDSQESAENSEGSDKWGQLRGIAI